MIRLANVRKSVIIVIYNSAKRQPQLQNQIFNGKLDLK